MPPACFLNAPTDSHTRDVGHWLGMTGTERTADYRKNVVGRDAHIAPPYSDLSSAVAPHQRQRHRKKDDPFIESKTEIPRERVVSIHKSVRIIARPEVKEPEVPSGAFAYFCHC